MNKDLTDEQKNILYNSGTEMPGTSDLLYEKRPGTYVTADKGLPVFRSKGTLITGLPNLPAKDILAIFFF